MSYRVQQYKNAFTTFNADYSTGLICPKNIILQDYISFSEASGLGSLVDARFDISEAFWPLLSSKQLK